MSIPALSVSQLNLYIKYLLEQDEHLRYGYLGLGYHDSPFPMPDCSPTDEFAGLMVTETNGERSLRQPAHARGSTCSQEKHFDPFPRSPTERYNTRNIHPEKGPP